jgi:hypothetical protein
VARQAVLLPPDSRSFDANLQPAKPKKRRTFATLLKGSGEDVKTTQELMRHANSRLTLHVYAQALTPVSRAEVVEMIRPAAEIDSVFVFARGGSGVCKCSIEWSGLSESNRHLNLGNLGS